MRINFVCKGALFAATLCIAPAALLASPKAGQPGTRTVAVNTGASLNDTLSLLQQIQSEAVSVKSNAGQLQALLREPFQTGWEADGDLLENVSAHVNEMSKLFSQLRAHEAEASPWQQAVIERIVPTSLDLADTTQDAIVTLNHNQGHVYASDLEGLTNDIYKQASLIGQTVGNLEKYASARHETRQLKQTLGLKTNPKYAKGPGVVSSRSERPQALSERPSEGQARYDRKDNGILHSDEQSTLTGGMEKWVEQSV